MEVIISASVLLLLITTLVALSGRTRRKKQNVNPALVAGIYHLADDDDDKALQELTKVILDGEAPPEIYLAVSVILRKKGELTKAIHLGEGQLYGRLPKEVHIIILKELMRCYRASGAMHRASRWTEGMSESELGADLLLIKADVLSESGEHEEAIKKYQKYASVTGISCNQEIALEYIKIAAKAQDKSYKVKSLRNAVKADPKNRKVHFILAQVFFDDNKKEQGIEELNEAIEKDLIITKENMKKLEELFYLHSSLDKLYEKISSKVSEGSSYPVPYLFLADLYTKKGDKERAAELLKDYMAQFGPVAVILRTYARVSADPVLVRATRLEELYVCGVCNTKYIEYTDICRRCGSYESLGYM